MSSFLEIACAMYATICIDKKFSLDLWKLDFSPTVQSILQNDANWETNDLKEMVEKCAEDKFNGLYQKFRFLGGLMMLICIYLLYCIGFEGGSYCVSWGFNVSIIFVVAILMSILYMLQMGYWIFNRVMVLLTNLVLALVCCWIMKDTIVQVAYTKSLQEDLFKYMIVGGLTLPFVYMMMWRFFLLNRENVHIDKFLKKELVILLKVKSAHDEKRKLKKKDVPEEYRKVVGEYNLHRGADESFESALAEAFRNRFNDDCAIPGILVLCVGWGWDVTCACISTMWSRAITR